MRIEPHPCREERFERRRYGGGRLEGSLAYVKREGFRFNPTICVSTVPLDLDEWVEDNIERIIVHETMHIAVTRLEGSRVSLSMDNVLEHLGDLKEIMIW